MMKLLSLILIFSLFLTSCMSPTENGKVTLDLKSRAKNKKGAESPKEEDNSSPPASNSSASITNITLSNDQITIDGTNLNGVTSVNLNDGGSLNTNLTFVSKTATQLILSAASSIILPLGSLVSLVMTDALGAGTTTVTFQLPTNSVGTAQIVDGSVTTTKIDDGAITVSKLSSMGAANGEVLVYDTSGSGAWVPTPLSGLSYKGAWNATTNVTPTLSSGGGTTSPTSGDYYTVGTAGGANIDGVTTWVSGDWIIFNGSTWQRINNAGAVSSFNGRTGGVSPQSGDYTWAMITKTTSSINDIADINTTGIADGKILKYNGTSSKWEISDDLSGGGAGTVTTTEISDGTIANVDINASAAIAQSKISGLTTSLSGKAPNPSATCAASNKLQWNGSAFTCVADLDTNTNANTVCTGATFLDGDGNCTAMTTDTNTNANTACTGATFLDGDGNCTAMTTDTNTNANTLCNAGEYLDGDGSCKTVTTGTGDFKKDGTVAMTGGFNGGGNSLSNISTIITTGNTTIGNDLLLKDNSGSNTVTVKAPIDITTDYVLTLPDNDGNANDVLTSNGSGVLSWNAPNITGTVLTGFVTGTNSTVLNTDTVEVGMEKLQGQMNNKLSLSGGTLIGNLDLGANNLLTTGTVDGVDVSALNTTVSGKAPNPSATCAASNKLQWNGSAFTCVADLDTNTNANTVCTGATFLDGDGNCTAMTTNTNTNANTVCTGATFLDGDGSCTAMTTDTSTVTLCGSGQLLDGDGNCIAIPSGSTPSISVKSADYTVTTSDSNKVFLVSGTTTLTLPPAATAGSGFVITVKSTDASNKITIDANAVEVIEGKEVRELKSLYATTQIISDGTSWYEMYSKGTIGTGSLDCPTGFIEVIGNATFSTSDFCVMKYEAKNDGSGNAVSQSAGTPYVSINATTSQSKCEAMTEGGFSGTFTLISSPEYMTIARDLENVASNWSGSSVGSGHIPRGHTDNSPASALAVADVNDPYIGTGNNSGQAAGSGWEQKRTHTLSNGSEIWDIAGNVWEWADWDAGSAGFTSGPTDASTGWKELSALAGSVAALDIQAAGGYTSTQSFGRWYGGSGGAALRGGR